MVEKGKELALRDSIDRMLAAVEVEDPVSIGENIGVFIEAGLACIPMVGGAAAVLFNAAFNQEFLRRRLTVLATEFSRLLKEMDKAKIDRDFLASEEFVDLARRALETAARTRSDEKIKMYARILRGSAEADCREGHRPEDYLIALSELSEFEVSAAKTIYGMMTKEERQENENDLQHARRMGWGDLPKLLNIDESEMVFTMKRIERTGLISEITGGYYGYSGGVYVITVAFYKLMKFLQFGRR